MDDQRCCALCGSTETVMRVKERHYCADHIADGLETAIAATKPPRPRLYLVEPGKEPRDVE